MDAFLNTIDPKLFERWRAWFRVKAAEQWEIAAHLAEHVWNTAVLTSDLSAEAKDKLYRERESFIPWQYRLRKPPTKRTAEQRRQQAQREAAMFRAAYGPKV